MTRIFLAFLWLFHWLPLRVQAAFGWLLGHLLYVLVAPRRRVVLTNLRLCFPELSETERRKLARRNVVAVTRSFLERGMVWWASEARIRRNVELRGLEKLQALQREGRAVIVLIPHFTNLDVGNRLAMEVDCVSVYSAQNNKLLEKMLLHGRTRFGNQHLLSRQEGIRGAVKALKTGRPLYYLPDMDLGPRDSIFVPFFGVQTATVPGLPRIAKLAKAAVIPLIILAKPDAQGYVCEFGEVWENFPSDDPDADTARMNAFIESEVRKAPEQYYWVHKRFKTRPPGEPKLY
ncbi:lysophospholipid acyltransferase family protein [Uliginosibacterium sp. 31-16]|uniref:lysophospholipid acyltransferase family protein n=1 Tax=Uliginosibacterium sp. 31-16 TaxID=3068315 RepID=UPI00273EC53B|nr:lysophospholipid acyltransferase family protein [Uliginosibacterium sp. 31-16]MDP5239368.1 lysophospholipid acyltransferase family protein [Uliginosibacterium sp. 31-16]